MTTRLENTTITERHLASILADVLTEHASINMREESKLLEEMGIDWKGMLELPEAMKIARVPSWKFPFCKMLSFIDGDIRDQIGGFESEIYKHI